MPIAIAVGGLLTVGLVAMLDISKPAKPSFRATKRMTSDGRSFDPALSPDGRLLAYASPAGGDVAHIWLRQIGGGDPIQVTSSAAGDSQPDFSPDGTRIAFQKVVGPNVDVYVKYLYGGAERRLTTDPGYDGVPTWSPDGTRIAFQSQRTGKSQIWVVNSATGGSLTQITKSAFEEKSATWSH